MSWVRICFRHPINREYARLTFDYQQLRGEDQRLWYYRSRLATEKDMTTLDRDFRRGNAVNTMSAALAVAAMALVLYWSF